MKFRCIAFALVLVLPLLLPAFAGDPISCRIQATATVTHPIGLLDAQQLADDFATPVVAEYCSRWFLYLPERGSVLIQLNGDPLDGRVSQCQEMVSLLDLSSLTNSRLADDSLVLTLIYSEN